MVDLYAQGRQEAADKDAEIAELRGTVQALQVAMNSKAVLPDGLIGELLVLFPDVMGLESGTIEPVRRDSMGLRSQVTLAVFNLDWRPELDSASRVQFESQLEGWLRERLQDFDVRVNSN